MVPLTGSEVVCCTLRWPVVWPLEVLLLLLLVKEELKEEVLVKLLEDMVMVGGGFGWVGVWISLAESEVEVF